VSSRGGGWGGADPRWRAAYALLAPAGGVGVAAGVGGGVISLILFLFYLLYPLPPNKAGPADNHDLHDFTSHDGFETTVTPKPLATVDSPGWSSPTLRLLAGCCASPQAARPPRCRRPRDELASPHIGSQAQATALHPLKQ